MSIKTAIQKFHDELTEIEDKVSLLVPELKHWVYKGLKAELDALTLRLDDLIDAETPKEAEIPATEPDEAPTPTPVPDRAMPQDGAN